MKHFKKVLSLVLALALLSITLAACSSGGTSSNSVPATDNSTVASGSETGSTSAASGDVVELKLSYSQPPTSPTGRTYDYFAEVAAEESGGTIIITTFPSGSLVNDTEVLDALQSGQVDIAHAATSYLSPTIKELSPLEVPGIFRSDRYMEYAYALAPIINEICEPYGIRHIFPVAGGTMSFLSNDSAITSPEDLNGLNVRASGKWVGEAVKLWGGAPATIALGDISTAMERKTVDAVYVGGVTVAGPFKLYELANYITYNSMQEIFGGMFMNQDSWDKLSEEQKEAFNRAIDKFAVYGEEQMTADNETYIQAYKDQGVNFYELTDEENKAFTDISMTLLDNTEMIELAGEKGQKLIDACADLREGYSKPYTPGVKPE